MGRAAAAHGALPAPARRAHHPRAGALSWHIPLPPTCPGPHLRGRPIILMQARMHGTPLPPTAPPSPARRAHHHLCASTLAWHMPLPPTCPGPHLRGGPIIFVQARLLGTPLPPTCPALTCAEGPSSPLAQRTPGIPSFHCLCRVCGVQEMYGHVEASAAKS